MHTDKRKSDGRWAPEVAPTELSPEIISRTLKEEQENNEIYRRRPQDTLDLSRTHYGHRHMLNWAIQQLPNLKGARVLDVGVGEGQSTVLLAGSGAHVTGIDISGEALARAKKLANSCHVHPDFLQMAGEDLHFPDASFDAILCISAYHHMDLEQATQEFVRVLRPGGRVVMIEPLASNPLAWLYRRAGTLFKREATSSESPLRIADVEVLQKYFRRVKCEGMFFLSVGLFGLDRLFGHSNNVMYSFTQSAFTCISRLDSVLSKVPGVQRIAWKIGIVAQL